MLELWPRFPVVPANASGQPMGQGVSFLEAVATEPSACPGVRETRGQDTVRSSSCCPLQRPQAEAAATLLVAPAGQNVPAFPACLGGCPWLIRLEMEKGKALTLS